MSNIGTWLQNVGAAWLMTTLDPSPKMVALVQAAGTLPVFLLALPGGALADVLDRRRVLIATQAWMLLASGLLAWCTWHGLAGPTLLLGLTFALGCGTAVFGPAWQASIPEIVPRRQLPAALALGSAGFNIARAIGPAIGGLLVAASGPAATFALNAISFLGVIVVLFRWKREPRTHGLPAEHFVGALRAGLRYVRHSPALQGIMFRQVLFSLGGAALWALLPLIAKTRLGFGAGGYGLLLGCLGAGALAGAAGVVRLRQFLGIDRLVLLAILIFAAALTATAWLSSLAILVVLMLAGGASWLVVLSSFNVAAQTAIAGWVRARALSVYMLLFFGGLGLGSALWGLVAEHAGIPWTMTFAAVAVLTGLPAALRWPLRETAGDELDPSQHWPEPAVMRPIDETGASVLVTVEYRIDPVRAPEFKTLMQRIRKQRLRDGALRWALFNDLSEPDKFLELFVVESWVEHLRQHRRATLADRDLDLAAHAFHVAEGKPAVRHYISETG